MSLILKRAATIVAASLLMFTAAHANGQVETALQLWRGDLKSAYDKSLDLIEDGKINDAKSAVETLQNLTYQMTTSTDAIEQNAKALSPELGAAWSDTKAAMLQVHLAVSSLKQQLGRQKPDVSTLTAAHASADAAVLKSWEFTKGFGKRYGAVAGGPVENAKQLFDGAVSDQYEKAVELLEAYNTDEGKPAIDSLKDLIGKLVELSELANRQTGEVSAPLAAAWAPAYSMIRDLQIQTGLVQASVGNSEIDLDDMISAYADANAAIVTSYKDVFGFGEKLRVISDDWD